MKTLASLFAAALCFAALAGSAAAKEIKSAKVCGPSECLKVANREKAALLVAYERPGSPPPASSFYTIELAIDVGGGDTVTSTLYYVPSVDMVRPAYDPDGDAGPSMHEWSRLTPSAATVFRAFVDGVEPFPKPDVASVAVGSKTVVDGADSYLRLFELPPTRASGSRPTEYAEAIDLRSTRPTPWTDMPSDLSYSPTSRMLERGAQVVKLPEDVFADMRAGRPLAADDDGGAPFPWRTLFVTLAAALAGAVAIAFLLRRARIGVLRRRPSEA